MRDDAAVCTSEEGKEETQGSWHQQVQLVLPIEELPLQLKGAHSWECCCRRCSSSSCCCGCAASFRGWKRGSLH